MWRNVTTHPTWAQAVEDLERINAMSVHTPLTKDLCDAAVRALWTCVLHMVPTDHGAHLQPIIAAMETAYRHYGAERFATGRQQGRREACEGIGAGPATPAVSVH